MSTLYLVATPIGNLEDLTLRAVRILREATFALCEDTRVTSKIFAHLEVKPRLYSVHEHTETGKIKDLLTRAAPTDSIAYVCDAGTPGMNDPGGKVVQIAYELGFRVIPIPGPSALTAAISVCGFPMEHFVYRGFIPHKKGKATLFKMMSEQEESVVFLESTHRMEKTLLGLKAVLAPARLIWIGRELTKQHETLYRGTIDEVLKQLQATSWKGEFICVLAPASYVD